MTSHPGRILVAGTASGLVVKSDQPLSLWGGLNPDTGEIIDRRHPLSGRNVAGAILVIPHGRGSCSASGVFLESIRNGTAPAGVIVSRVDPIIGLGSILGDELYGRPVPIIMLPEDAWTLILDGDNAAIQDDGSIHCGRPDRNACSTKPER